VKGIIEEHGGTIDVESIVDKGTIFWIRLPLDNTQPASNS
jgi:signal transduction histidine kinase